MRYLRVFTDADGETHVEDVELATEERRSPVSSARALIGAPIAVHTLRFRHVVVDHPPTEPHVAPQRQFVVHLVGQAEIEVSDGETRRVGPGDVVLVEDTHGKGHITRRIGDDDRVTMMVELRDEPALVGTWRLTAWTAHLEHGEVRHPFGRDAHGLLVYDRDGHMAGMIERADRPAFAQPRVHAVDVASGDDRELAQAFNSFLSYAGRWELVDGTVHHHVEVASIPGWVGTTLERTVTFDGEALVLRTPPRTVDGVRQHGVLRWERAR